MQITAKKPKTAEEIAAEIAALRAVQPRVPRHSHFGDNNHAAIEAQITVLLGRLNRDQVRARFPEDGADKLFMALIASDWMHGELVGPDNTPPSKDWAPEQLNQTAEVAHG